MDGEESARGGKGGTEWSEQGSEEGSGVSREGREGEGICREGLTRRAGGGRQTGKRR